MAKEYKMTQAKVNEMEKELHYLKTVREQEVVELIKEARSFGDLSENSEYDEAKNEQAKLYGRIAEIEDILAHAVLIVDENEVSGRIGLGCTVVLKDLSDGSTDTYKITGSNEVNPMENKFSDDSPFGRALVGKGIGEVVVVEAPTGKFEFEVLDVQR